jgi:hypothetical protein
MMNGTMARALASRPLRVRDILVAAVPGLRDRMLEDTIRSSWAEIAGPEIARRSRPGELRAGVLTVLVDNSPWLQEVTLRSTEILAGIRARHGSAVTSVRCALGTLPAPRQAVTHDRPPPADPLSAEEQRAVDTIIAPVTDPVLAASVRRLVTKDLIARRRRDAVPPARRERT